MGVLSESCGSTERTYFFQSLREGGGVELAAVVLQRRQESRWKKGPVGAVGFFHHLFAHLFSDPRRKRVASRPDVPAAGAWSSTGDFGGPTEACFSAERRIVRVAAQDFALPSDPRTFVVLLDEVAGDQDGPRVSTTLIDVPSRPRGRLVHHGSNGWWSSANRMDARKPTCVGGGNRIGQHGARVSRSSRVRWLCLTERCRLTAALLLARFRALLFHAAAAERKR
jgi:hypothetical protein